MPFQKKNVDLKPQEKNSPNELVGEVETEVKTYKKKQSFLPEINAEKTYEFELINLEFGVNHGIGSTAIVYDTDEGTERQVRYVPGWASIFVDEQPEIDEHLIPKADINFSRGKLIVQGRKKQLVQYLLINERNESVSSGQLEKEYRLIDDGAKYDDIRARLAKKSEAISAAVDADFSEVLPYAKVLGINTVKVAGVPQKDYESRVRAEFMAKAEESPFTFLKGFSDPKHKRRYDLMLAFEQNIITDSINDREVNWKSGTVVVNLPASGAPTLDFLTDFTYTELGKEFYETLKKQIKY